MECRTLLWSMRLGTPNEFTGIPLKLKERNISNLKQKKALKSQLAGGRPVGYSQE